MSSKGGAIRLTSLQEGKGAVALCALPWSVRAIVLPLLPDNDSAVPEGSPPQPRNQDAVPGPDNQHQPSTQAAVTPGLASNLELAALHLLQLAAGGAAQSLEAASAAAAAQPTRSAQAPGAGLVPASQQLQQAQSGDPHRGAVPEHTDTYTGSGDHQSLQGPTSPLASTAQTLVHQVLRHAAQPAAGLAAAAAAWRCVLAHQPQRQCLRCPASLCL